MLLGFLVSCIPIAITCLYILSWITPWPVRTRKDLLQPMFVYTPTDSGSEQFKSLLTYDDDLSGELHCTKPDLYLSIIIPAMNEQVNFLCQSCFVVINEHFCLLIFVVDLFVV